MSAGALYVAAAVLAALVSAGATPLVKRLATHLGVLDAVGERRMHDVPKPRVGGLAVGCGCA